MKTIFIFCASLADRPLPLSPMWITCLPRARKRGSTRSMLNWVPPTIKISVPFSAAILDPVTGASRSSQPCSCKSNINCKLAEGEMVLESTTMVPLPSPSTAPCGPKITCLTALVSETQGHTPSLPLAASAGVRAVLAPGTSGPGVRFQTVTSCPALARFVAMGRPIIPNPKKATRILLALKILLGDGVKSTVSCLPASIASLRPAPRQVVQFLVCLNLAEGFYYGSSFYPACTAASAFDNSH